MTNQFILCSLLEQLEVTHFIGLIMSPFIHAFHCCLISSFTFYNACFFLLGATLVLATITTLRGSSSIQILFYLSLVVVLFAFNSVESPFLLSSIYVAGNFMKDEKEPAKAMEVFTLLGQMNIFIFKGKGDLTEDYSDIHSLQQIEGFRFQDPKDDTSFYVNPATPDKREGILDCYLDLMGFILVYGERLSIEQLLLCKKTLMTYLKK